MSCQENCEAISEPSSVRSVTFAVAGSWCLPGALGPNWDLSAKPGELPRLLSFSFTHCLSHFLFCLVLYLYPSYLMLFLCTPCLPFYHAINMLSAFGCIIRVRKKHFNSRCKCRVSVHQVGHISRWSGFYWM